MEVVTQLQNGQGCILKPHSVPHLTETNETSFATATEVLSCITGKKKQPTKNISTVQVWAPMHNLQLYH